MASPVVELCHEDTGAETPAHVAHMSPCGAIIAAPAITSASTAVIIALIPQLYLLALMFAMVFEKVSSV